MIVDLKSVMTNPTGTEFQDTDEGGAQTPMTMKKALLIIAQAADQADAQQSMNNRIFWGDLVFRLHSSESELVVTAEEIQKIKERAARVLTNNMFLWAICKGLEGLKST